MSNEAPNEPMPTDEQQPGDGAATAATDAGTLPDPADAPPAESEGATSPADAFQRLLDERERSEAASRGQADLARQLLDGLDDLARFAHLDPAQVESRTVVEGAAMVERKLLKVLGDAGLELVDADGKSFDPNVHEAVSTEPAASPEDDHVVSRVFQRGYIFKGQLLRPARVVVKQWNG
jgi:molecular chaperone GrpE